MRVVLDANVLVAAFFRPVLGPSFSRDVFDHVVRFHECFVSEQILAEFKRILLKKLNFSSKVTRNYTRLLEELVTVVSNAPMGDPPVVEGLRDVNDRHVVWLATAVNAKLILTWDKDLLVLPKAGKFSIQTPRQFWDMK